MEEIDISIVHHYFKVAYLCSFPPTPQIVLTMHSFTATIFNKLNILQLRVQGLSVADLEI